VKRLSSDDWARIKTEYQFGEKSIRQIAGENGITDTAIRSRIKSENWNREVRNQVIDIKKNIEQISQLTSHEQKPYVVEKIKNLFDVQLEAMGLVKDMSITALKIHKNIVTKINNELAKAANGEKSSINIPQAVMLLKAQGMDVSGSLKSLGIGVKEAQLPDDKETEDNSAVKFYLPVREDD